MMDKHLQYYDLPKESRALLREEIYKDILDDISKGRDTNIRRYFSDEDTYIRKAAYLATAKLYLSYATLRNKLVKHLEVLLADNDHKIRQTVINATGEIGKTSLGEVAHFFDKGLFDAHHFVRNAVIGSIKKMGEKNPKPVLKWARSYLHHPDKEIRREICHGIELRGRTHPEDILPLLEELQHDKTSRVKNTLVHVLGQISYKKGCLQKVIPALLAWENQTLVEKAIEEIIDVHYRYRNFTALTQQEAIAYINNIKRP